MRTFLGRLGSACCAVLAVTALLGSQPAQAEGGPPYLQPYFGAFGGLHMVVGEWDLSAIDDEGISPKSSVVFGARAGLQVNHWFGFEGEVGFIPFNLAGGGGGLAMDWALNTLWSPFDYVISPYGLVGIGMYHSTYGDLGDDADWEFHYGFGFRTMLADWVAFRLEARHIITDSYTDNLASNVEWTLGIDLFPWAYTDKPAGDKDTDGDGLYDSQDDCPLVPGPAITRGCPDSDNDGVRNRDDRCPNMPGPPANNGCPDTDGDGIYDDIDKCKIVPGVPEHEGCPPPQVDSDGDGIMDDQDKCPSIKGVKEADGCIPEAFQRFTGAIEDIYFESGSAKLKRKSFATLNEAVDLLKKYPSIHLEVNGHTDSQGPGNLARRKAYNQKLSDDRAASVMNYLISKGISASRLTAKGYGQEQPIADNNTRKGRAKNRRTEFKVVAK